MTVEVNNLQSVVSLKDSLLQTLVTLGQEILAGESSGRGEVSINLVDDKYIASLNQRFRKVAGATDVLAFPLMEAGDPEPLLGDVFVSVERAVVQAREYGHSLEREAAFLASHGILHLLGYGHHTPVEEEKMRRKQEEYLAAAGLQEKD